MVNNSTAEIPDADKPSYTHAESGHITGTWKGNGEQSHEESSVEQNRFNQDMNGSVLVDDNNGDFLNELNPVYDDHGLVLYYQRSSETYKKGEDLYDRNGDFVRHQDSDNLEEYNLNAYRINEHDELYDASQEKKTPERKNLYHLSLIHIYIRRLLKELGQHTMEMSMMRMRDTIAAENDGWFFVPDMGCVNSFPMNWQSFVSW